MKRGVSVTNGLADLANGLVNEFSNLTISDETQAQPTQQEVSKPPVAEEPLNLENIARSFNDPESCLGFLTHPIFSGMIGPIELQQMVAGLQSYLDKTPFRPPALSEIGHTLARNPQWCQWLSYPAFIPYMNEDKKLREYIVSSADFLMHLDHKLISDIVVDLPDNALTVLKTLYNILKSTPPDSHKFKLTILTLQWIKERSPSVWAQSENLDGYIAEHGDKNVKVIVIPKDHVTTYTPLRAALQSTQDSIDRVVTTSEPEGKAKKVVSYS